MPQRSPAILRTRTVVHLTCLATLSGVLYASSSNGSFGYLIPLMLAAISLATNRLFKHLSGRALIADIVGSVSLTMAILLMIGFAPLEGATRAASNALIVVGIVAFLLQIRFNLVDRQAASLTCRISSDHSFLENGFRFRG